MDEENVSDVFMQVTMSPEIKDDFIVYQDGEIGLSCRLIVEGESEEMYMIPIKKLKNKFFS